MEKNQVVDLSNILGWLQVPVQTTIISSKTTALDKAAKVRTRKEAQGSETRQWNSS